jgi:hypothetical protein
MRRLAALLFGALALSACQVDIVVDIDVEPDGTGTINVTVSADADVVDRVPTLADDLVLDDVAAAGWQIDGPTTTADGGLTIALGHDFASADEATHFCDVRPSSPTGPRAWNLSVLMPISAPRPYSKPSAKRVEAFTITEAESTSRRKRIARV